MRLGIHPARDCATVVQASPLCITNAGAFYKRASEGIDYADLGQSNCAFL